MKIFPSTKIAVRALCRNKMRSLLTMLGVIIGVGAVIGSVSLTSGATRQVENQVASLGENVIVVFPGSSKKTGIRKGWGSAPTLTVGDAKAIRQLPSVAAVSPDVQVRSQILANGRNWNAQVKGESPAYCQILNRTMVEGAMFNSQDIRSLAKVAIVGQTVVQQLFPEKDPLSHILRVGNIPFQIVGVLAPKGFNLFGQDQDNVVIIPYTSLMHRMTGRNDLNYILVEALNKGTIDLAQREIINLLKFRHHKNDFTVRNQQELMKHLSAASRTMGLLLACVAAVSLLVGGIGIMNIMLVSVSERTREIGLRMAVGARARDVLIQFLTEALILSTIGGAIGIVAGISFSSLIAYLQKWPSTLPLVWIVIAFVASAIIGVVAGFYPAWRASLLDPIEALRYE